MFYIIAILQGLLLVVVYYFEEELDIENLRKYDAIELEEEGDLKSDDKSIEL